MSGFRKHGSPEPWHLTPGIRSPDPEHREATLKKIFPWWGVAGIAVFAGGLYSLLEDVPQWNAVWYVPAWSGYLLILDAAIFLLQGNSFLSHRRRELAAMMLWSVPFWYLFEAFNVRLHNWYYVFALRSDAAGAAMGVAAFSTVLPACFFHAELTKALGLFRSGRRRALPVTPRIETLCLAMGVASIAGPLILPRYAFPLVWGATFWIPEVVNRRTGAPSLLRDLEGGHCSRLLRLLAGGLAAGVVWETLNSAARTKWIYTVPGFEQWKGFEMPFAGYLGFPVLAVGAFSFSALIGHYLRGGRSWERPDDQPAASVPRRRYLAALVAAAVFCAAAFVGLRSETVRSRRPTLAELAGLDASAEARLRAAAIPTPERFYRAALRDGLPTIARRSGLPLDRLSLAFRHAALALHKGMGPRAAALLQEAGISAVSDFARADPEVLWHRLSEFAAWHGEEAPRPAEVKVWIRAADPRGLPKR